MKQTKPAVSSICAGFAAYPWCWTGLLRAATWAGFLLFTPRLALAEVMDKEVPVSVIWLAAAVGLPVAVLVGLFRRWLLLPAFVMSMLAGPALAWVEWHDPSVGPAIAVEAGTAYGWHAQSAVVLLLVVHASLWFFFGVRVRARRAGPWVPLVDVREASHTVLFVAGLAVSLLLLSIGADSSVSLWTSPPMVFAASLLVASTLWWSWASWVAS